MHVRHPSRTIWLLLTISLSLGACGGGEDQTTSEGSEQNSGMNSSGKAAIVAKSKPSEPAGMCSLVSAADVTAALGGKLPLAPPKTLRSGCEYPVQFGIDGNALTYKKVARGHYDNLRHYENEKGAEFEFIAGLGQEAFIVNGAQVCVLLNDNEALFVSAMVMAFGEELPITKEELKAGLIEIATKVEARL